MQDTGDIALDPVEHQAHVFASREEVEEEELVGGVRLAYISAANKRVKLEGFRLQQGA